MLRLSPLAVVNRVVARNEVQLVVTIECCDQGRLHGHATLKLPRALCSEANKALQLGLMLGCCHPEILNTYL